MSILLNELLSLYARNGDDAALARATPTATIWPGSPRRIAMRRGGLARGAGGPRRPDTALVARSSTPAGAPEQITLALSPTLSQALGEQARRQGLTLTRCCRPPWAICWAVSPAATTWCSA